MMGGTRDYLVLITDDGQWSGILNACLAAVDPLFLMTTSSYELMTSSQHPSLCCFSKLCYSVL